ncbi:MAG: UDP-glucose 4-epimerase, partial [Bacilli bacterium]
VDLAKGHLASLKVIKDKSGLKIYNLGTGRGTSVFELVKAFEKVNNIRISYVVGPRRDGDIDANYANCDKALKEINWKANLSIEDCCRDAWNWQKRNPYGYGRQ